MSELQSLINKFNKDAEKKGQLAPFKKASEMLPNSFISTGIHDLDEALGGGFVRGVISVLWGQPGCGKTRVALSTAKVVLDSGGTVIFIDTENLTRETLLSAEIDLDNPELMSRFFILSANDSGDQALNRLNELIYDTERCQSRGIVDLIIVDSTTNLATESEITTVETKGLQAHSQLGRLAALLTKFTTNMNGRGLLGEGPTGTVFLGISQQRARIGDEYNPVKPTGGFAIEHNAKLSIHFTTVRRTTRKNENHFSW